jgi:hypothetical protein
VGKRLIAHKFRQDPKLVQRLDHQTNVVAKDLAQGFVYLCVVSLRPKLRSKFRLDHREGSLSVASFVVVLIEFILMVQIEMQMRFQIVVFWPIAELDLKGMYGIAPFVSASLMLLAHTNWAKKQRKLVLTRFIANYSRKVLYNLALSLN